MKRNLILLSLVLSPLLVVTACSSPADTPATETADVVTTASIVVTNDAFENAISKNGTWIVATLNDMTFDKEIVMDGDFRNKGLAENDLYRKLALYTQDADHNIIDKFTLTAPKFTIKSPAGSIQGGIFVGDVYVEADGFVLSHGAKVEGNVYFATEAFKTSANLTDGVVTGKVEVK